MANETGQNPSTSQTKSQVFFNFEKFDREKILWSRWQKRLESAFIINETPEDKKLHLLLHHIGYATYYNTLCDKLSPDEPEKKNYEDVCKVLIEVFDPKPLEIVENYRFHLSRQLEHQSVDEFAIELIKVALNCNFGTYLNTALRNQFVFGLKNKAIRSRLLEQTDLDLGKAIKIARQMELSDQGNVEIAHNLKERSPVATVSKNDYEQYIGTLNENELKPSDINLVSYTGNGIKVYGHSLLGREWLRVLPFDWNKVFRGEHMVSQIDGQTALNTLKQKYPRVFDAQSMGKITGLKARIHLKPDTPPIFKKARKPAFAMRKRIEIELDELVRNGVLKKVETSEYATPIVPVPKSNDKVRICGD
ncbi:uncharacterized protein LOC129572134 [Sitodiplosis mosellana]|uniref:uncharacterized protein LOC129572134 n=1 Tax=Sitodiplosis mosellana TaxID=263140 RepID=UPI0024450124|nr:uncharacterized protein LOC129572134 [Sitodiplosis mosellana]